MAIKDVRIPWNAVFSSSFEDDGDVKVFCWNFPSSKTWLRSCWRAVDCWSKVEPMDSDGRIDWMKELLIDWLIDWLIYWLIDKAVRGGWWTWRDLSDWLIGGWRLICWSTGLNLRVAGKANCLQVSDSMQPELTSCTDVSWNAYSPSLSPSLPPSLQFII